MTTTTTTHDHDHDHDHHGHSHDHDHPPGGSEVPVSRFRGAARIMVPFGAAASPDLTILPVFLAAAATGGLVAAGALVVFAGATILTMVGLTLFACFGGYQVRGQWLDRWGNAVTALVLLVIGTLIITGVV